ncbi:MAG TPA: acetyl-CoA hydrolase/transferase C-terminal domain-containing protein [Polyangiaceae bacterium]|nr:acetyl-CoA hydrolase/transferase C-terminal domain-containing protein [Polyangiaceae bacterium]
MTRVTTAEEALAILGDGMRVLIGSGAAAPTSLVEALTARARSLRGVEVCQLLTLGSAPYVHPELEGHIRHNAFFIGENTRTAVDEGRADFTPVFLSEIASLLRGPLPIDVALVQVSPPDPHGFCSLGVSVDIVKPAVDVARVVVAEVNAAMPRTHGDAFVHWSRIDHAVHVDRKLPELPREAPSAACTAIGEHVASLVRDGDTLQLGIGTIPDAVLGRLGSHRHLGIHTEMFSDGVVDLVERGVVDNSRKSLHRGKLVTSFVMGSERLYRFVHDNPGLEMHPSHYVNDPFIVAKNRGMVAVNSALSVDLTGQVSADTVGPRLYSGVGGQVDFIRGAARAEEGRPIIALPSTARGGKVSRITADLALGSGVTTTRNDVRYVVTEFGVAPLWGMSVRERADALIAIAHPDFREDLARAAREHRYLR